MQARAPCQPARYLQRGRQGSNRNVLFDMQMKPHSDIFQPEDIFKQKRCTFNTPLSHFLMFWFSLATTSAIRQAECCRDRPSFWQACSQPDCKMPSSKVLVFLRGKQWLTHNHCSLFMHTVLIADPGEHL